MIDMGIRYTFRCLLAAFLLLGAIQSHAQTAGSYQDIALTQQPGSPYLQTIPNAPVVVCNYPATGSGPCSNLATTYTNPSAATACSTSTQVVAPGTSTCSSKTDAYGNFGFFVLPGGYVYYWQSPNGTWNGPYTVGAPQGATGTTGPANSLTIGGVTTGPAGSQASATINGTAPNQTLNLVLPAGPAGTAGSTVYSLPTPTSAGGVYMPVACPPVTDPLNGLSVPQHVYAINYSTGQLLCSQDNNWDLAVEVNGQAVATGVRAINFVGSAGMQITAASNQATGVVTYTVTGSTATQAQSVTFNPLAGAYSGAQSVVLACASSSPTIYYTTDGTTPTHSSNIYGSPISMSAGTIEAICSSAGLADSNVASSSYSQTAPATSLSASTLTFGSVQTGTSSSPYTVGLTNTGNAPLTISSFAMMGSNAGDFSESNSCGSGLAVNASCTIGVMFTPSAGGTRTATLNVNDNAAGSPQIVSLSGTGVIPPLTIPTQTIAGWAWNTANSQQLTASGGIAPYTWSMLSSELYIDNNGVVSDAGANTVVSVSSSGVVSGSINGTQPHGVHYFHYVTFTVQVTDSTGATATQTFSVSWPA